MQCLSQKGHNAGLLFSDTALWLATLDEAGPSGGFFRDGEPIDW